MIPLLRTLENLRFLGFLTIPVIDDGFPRAGAMARRPKDQQSSQTRGIERLARFLALTALRCCAPVLSYISYVLASPEVELLAAQRARAMRKILRSSATCGGRYGVGSSKPTMTLSVQEARKRT